MKKLNYLLIAFAFLNYNAFSQEAIIIKGSVVDKKGAALDNVKVSIIGINQTFSNSSGEFFLKVSFDYLGSIKDINFALEGYESVIIKDHFISRPEGAEDKNNLGNIILEKKREKLSFSNGFSLGSNIEFAKVVGDAAYERVAEDFPLGLGLGALLFLQLRPDNSNLSIYLNGGYLRWESEATIYVTEAVIKNTMDLYPIKAGVNYHIKNIYCGIETGIFISCKKGEIVRPGTNIIFDLPNDYHYNWHQNIGVSTKIGYERKIKGKHFVYAEIAFTDILNPRQYIYYFSTRLGYLFYLKKTSHKHE